MFLRPFAIKRQSLVHGFTPELGAVVRPVRGNAPQVSDTPLAEAVVTLQSDGVPGQLVAQGTGRRGVQHCSHFVLAVSDGLVSFPRCQAAEAGLHV